MISQFSGPRLEALPGGFDLIYFFLRVVQLLVELVKLCDAVLGQSDAVLHFVRLLQLGVACLEQWIHRHLDMIQDHILQHVLQAERTQHCDQQDAKDRPEADACDPFPDVEHNILQHLAPGQL